METTVKSDILIAKIQTKGAELISLRDYNDTEYIWQGNPAVWGRHAPLLFPFICNTKSGSYTVGGKPFSLNNHGFARDVNWELIRAKEDSAAFILESNEETKRLFPFDFELTANYTVKANTFLTKITVANTGSSVMPFFIGGHPAFNVPLKSADKFTDWFVSYGDDDKLPLSHKTFENDVLLRDHPENGVIKLLSKTSDTRISLKFDRQGTIAVWSSFFPDDPAKTENAKFVCLEPWTSPPVYTEKTEELLEMERTVKLSPGKTFDFSYSIEIDES